MSYAALTAIASDFDALPKTHDAVDAPKRIAASRDALDKTATEIGEHAPADEAGAGAVVSFVSRPSGSKPHCGLGAGETCGVG